MLHSSWITSFMYVVPATAYTSWKRRLTVPTHSFRSLKHMASNVCEEKEGEYNNDELYVVP